MKKEIADLIKKLDLKPHPEGGYFKETYRSNGFIPKDGLGEDFTGPRNFSTCIYFLLTSETFSAFHRIKQDELWHFYKGSTLELHIITEAGRYSKVYIGNNIENGEVPQFVVPAGAWFAANIKQKNGYSLVGCTVSPGFDFADFELAKKDELIAMYPKHREIIDSLTR